MVDPPRAKRWGDLSKAFKEGAQDGIRDTAKIIQGDGNILIEAEAFDNGDLLASTELQEEEGEVRAAWTAEHAKYVHFGSGPAIGNEPYWPPILPLLRWVQRNVTTGQNPSTGKKEFYLKAKEGRAPRRSDTFKVSDGKRGTVEVRAHPEEIRIAYAIQKKIHDEGQEPVPFATKGVPRARQEGPILVRDAMKEATQRMSR